MNFGESKPLDHRKWWQFTFCIMFQMLWSNFIHIGSQWIQCFYLHEFFPVFTWLHKHKTKSQYHAQVKIFVNYDWCLDWNPHSQFLGLLPFFACTPPAPELMESQLLPKQRWYSLSIAFSPSTAPSLSLHKQSTCGRIYIKTLISMEMNLHPPLLPLKKDK